MISYLIPLKITTICVKIKFMTWLPKQKLLKRLSKNNSILLKNHCQHFKPIGTTSNKEVTEILQEQNKLLIKWNKSETKIIEMLVESQNKSRNDQKSTEKFEVVKHKKYCKPRSIENEPVNCQNRYETLYTDGNDEESENSSDSYIRETSKQVWSRISKKKRLKNKSTITVDEETNRSLIQLISNQWYQPRQDNNINHCISQPPVEILQSSYGNIVSRKKKKKIISSDRI